MSPGNGTLIFYDFYDRLLFICKNHNNHKKSAFHFTTLIAQDVIISLPGFRTFPTSPG